MDNLLKEWGVQDASIISSFTDNLIEVEDLTLLSEADMRDLVPQVGPRNRIKAKIEELRKSKDVTNNNSIDSRNEAKEQQKTLQISEKQMDLLYDIAEESSNLNENLETGSMDATGEIHKSTGNQTYNDLNQTKEKPKTMTVTADKSSHSSKDYDLKSILQNSAKGHFVLNQFKANNKLIDPQRSKLSDVIINNEVRGDLNKRITRERIKFLAQQVVLLFPTELLSTWYRVEERPNQNGTSVKGRLVTRFYTLRRTLASAGMLDEEDDIDDTVDTVSEEEPDGEVAEAVAWLKSQNISPWTRVLSAWRSCSKYRLRKLQAESAAENVPEKSSKSKSKKITRKRKCCGLKVVTYTADYPQIKEPRGWHLLEIDFELYKQDSILKLSAEYPRLERFVLAKLKQLNKDMLFDDFDDKTNDEKAIFIFTSLSKFFQVTTLTNNRSKANWRPSKQEMSDAFLLQVNTRAVLEETLRERQNRLSQFGFPNQPLPIVVGNENSNKECLVIFDQVEYVLETPMKAVDIAFKSYHALHAEYPAESEQIWLFLQKAVYKFKSNWDRYLDSTEILVTEFNKFV